MKRSPQILPISIFLGFFLLLSWYTLLGLQTLITGVYFPKAFWLIVILFSGALLYAIQSIASRGMDLFFKISAHAFLVFFVSELCFALLLLAGDLYRGLYAIVQLIFKHEFLSPSRSIYWISFAFIVFLLSILLFLYGILRGKYTYKVIKHTLYFEDLPAAFNGFTITQISDVHAGSLKDSKAVQKGINLIQKQQSDLFVFTGDLVNNKAEEINPWLSHFSQIKAPYGQFSVLGNHDYGDYIKWPNDRAKAKNLERLKDYHAALGFRLLLNEQVRIKKGNIEIALLGIENWGLGFSQKGDLQKALGGGDGDLFKILLSHDPSHWEAQVKKSSAKIQLTLAGHTHGMQFGIEAFGLKWSPVKYRYKHWAGIKTENGRVLNINRGFGFIGFSGRIGIWPEITVIELKKS